MLEPKKPGDGTDPTDPIDPAQQKAPSQQVDSGDMELPQGDGGADSEQPAR